MDDKTKEWMQVMIPILRQAVPEHLAKDIVGVQPMAGFLITEEQMWEACLAVELRKKLEADLALEQAKP